MQPSKDELRAFVGPNADYYLQGWAAAKPAIELQRLRWNWPAFFLNIVWLLYRRMYRYFWIGVGVLVAIGIVEGAAEALLHFKTPAYLDFVINFSIAYFFGAFGTSFYYRHALDTITKTRPQLTRPDQVARVGGVRLALALVFGLVLGVAVLAAIAAKFGPAAS